MKGNTVAGPSTGEDQWLPLAQQLAREIRKQRHAAGLSQPRLAERIGYTKQYVSLAERPRRGLPSAALVKAIDDALGAEGAFVALRDEADTARKACRPGNSPSTMDEDTSTTGQETTEPPDPAEVKNSKRRELITVAAAITFGEELDEPVERILATADEPQVPTRVRAGDVAHLHSTWETLRARSDREGGVAVRHQALAALRWATAMMRSSCTPDVRQELAVMTAKLADSASWYSFDAGHREPARRLSLLGLWAAYESGDLGMRAWVASGLARQEIYQGNWAVGLELTQLAFTAGEALTPNGIADLHTVKALAYARKPDTAECHRYISAATDTYQPSSAPNGPFWLRYFTLTTVEKDLADAKYDLIVGGAAVDDRTAERVALIDTLSTAFHRYPADRLLGKAIVATRLATLLCLEDERRIAHQMVENTITLAGQVRSARLADDLRILLRTLPSGNGTDEYLRDLRQRLSTTLTEMT